MDASEMRDSKNSIMELAEATAMTICINNLRLRTYVGIHEWEQRERQDVVITILIRCRKDALKSCRTDAVADTINYKEITKRVIRRIEEHRFMLLEKLVQEVLDLVLSHPLAANAVVRAEKPGALRFSDSVWVELSGSNE